MLRPYQQRAIDDLYAWFRAGNEGNPCMVLPTGAGKSHIVAALCKDALQQWPETRVLMLTHVKELIVQNAGKMREHWPGAPMGIYSASVGKKQLGEPITFAGIQSIAKKAALVGHVDLVIIDECHLVSHKEEGGYRTFLDALKAINPELRVIGLTATPYRLGHGLITDKPAIFDDLLESVTIAELVYKGFLSVLRSKVTELRLDVSSVHRRGGEYIESEMQDAVDTDENNRAVVSEVMALGADRKAWLFFCAGVRHAEHIRDILQERGITAECVTGATPKGERDRIISDYKAGKIRALTNANVLTTGFDYPGIDLIAMLRPTLSPGLYVQMAGRGLRIAPGKEDCLVLDFAGVVAKHGPITAVEPPKKGGSGDGEAPIKVCESCGEIAHISAQFCPACGAPFPAPPPKALVLHDDDIMGMSGHDMQVTGWKWTPHISKASGKEMLKVTYYGSLSDKPVTEYFPIMHEGYAGQKAVRALAAMGLPMTQESVGLDEIAIAYTAGLPPREITYKMDGKFHRVLHRRFA